MKPMKMVLGVQIINNSFKLTYAKKLNVIYIITNQI